MAAQATALSYSLITFTGLAMKYLGTNHISRHANRHTLSVCGDKKHKKK